MTGKVMAFPRAAHVIRVKDSSVFGICCMFDVEAINDCGFGASWTREVGPCVTTEAGKPRERLNDASWRED
jgi:hypothetical protein